MDNKIRSPWVNTYIVDGFKALPNTLTKEQYEALPLSQRYNPKHSKRTGLITRKLGMISEWHPNSARILPLTVLKVDDNLVIERKVPALHNHRALVIGAWKDTTHKGRAITKPLRGYFDSQNVEPRRKLKEFEVSEDGMLPVGTVLNASHFVPGQRVDCLAKSKGKGFQGVMKRYGFKGQPASHGVSRAHRKPGSSGPKGPGKVRKGKKMPGRMGGNKVQQKRLVVHKIDNRLNLIIVAGSVPGPKKAFVFIRDSQYVLPPAPLPLPTFSGDVNSLPDQIVAEDHQEKVLSIW